MQFIGGSKGSFTKPILRGALNLYTVPPRGSVDLEQFKDWAVLRYKVLSKLEDFSLTKKDEKELEVAVRSAEREIAINTAEDFRRDHVSHYILRLAYCENEEMRKWFLKQECMLLSARMKKGKDVVGQLFEENAELFPFPKVASEDLPADMKREVGDGSAYYLVPFQDYPSLVGRRQFLIKDGSVYVPDRSIESIILNKFRQTLSKALTTTSRDLFRIEEDERIARILKALRKKCVGQEFSQMSSLTGTISLDTIDALAEESFPPCMLRLHHALRENHHLKHGGRLQYGLFLKHIGVTLEQSLAFWKKEFTQKVDAEKFEKMYAYNIRHSYGREGKRTNYTAYSCVKIITSNPPQLGDHHGCYFKHSDSKWLKQNLTEKVGFGNADAVEIVQFAEDQKYHLACEKYFTLRHQMKDSPADLTITHPNQYFIESRKIRSPQVSIQYEEPPP